MSDGIWQVTTKDFCAGYVVKYGQIVYCAPILRRRIQYWVTRAVYIGP